MKTKSVPQSTRDDGLRAYTVLIHAEIEAYFERVAGALLKHVRARFYTRRVISPALLCILATSMGQSDDAELDAEDRLKPPRGNWGATSEDWVDHCCSQMGKVIGTNHGVREKNLKKLFGPFGLKVDEIDGFLLGNLEDLARRRGTIAHNHMGMYQLKEPTEHRTLAKNIIGGLPAFVSSVRKLV